MNRASRRENIFLDPEACALFLRLLAELPTRFRVRVLAYAIMPNHYHLLLECPDGNLSVVMKFLGAEFTQRLNRRNGWDGPIFRGRFKSRLVTTDNYLAHLFAYIHLNPVRAGMAFSADEARLTSHRALLGLESRPTWLDGDGLTESYGTPEAYVAYVRALQDGRVDPPDEWVRLWSRTPPPNVLPKRGAPDIAACIASIAQTTGVSVQDVLEPSQPREVRQLAAWALTQRISNVEAAKLLNCSAARVSQLRAAARTGGLVEKLRARELQSEPPLFLRDGAAATYRAGGQARWLPVDHLHRVEARSHMRLPHCPGSQHLAHPDRVSPLHKVTRFAGSGTGGQLRAEPSLYRQTSPWSRSRSDVAASSRTS